MSGFVSGQRGPTVEETARGVLGVIDFKMRQDSLIGWKPALVGSHELVAEEL